MLDDLMRGDAAHRPGGHGPADASDGLELIDALPDGVAILDPFGAVAAINDRLLALLGRAAREPRHGELIGELVAEDDRLELTRALSGVAEGEEREAGLAVGLRHSGGGLIEAELHLAGVGDGGRILATVRPLRARALPDAVACSWEYLPELDEVHGLSLSEGRADLGARSCSLSSALARVAPGHRVRVRGVIEDIVHARLDEARFDHPVMTATEGVEWQETRMWARRDERGSVLSVQGTSRPLEDPAAARRRLAGGHEAGSAERLRRALEAGDFELHAQPIVELASGAPVQHELLLRLRDADGALLRPASFLPAAEASGLILPIDSWVLDEALRHVALGTPVELNFSARSVCSSRTLERLRSGLRESAADPELLVIELTETALLADELAAARFVREARELGCRVALDDFGTGFSSLAFLKRLPVDFLKIDKEFVLDLPGNDASRCVVEAVVSLAEGLGQRTVAEGVENADTLGLLAELGVDYAQGYAIARPAPVDQVLAAV